MKSQTHLQIAYFRGMVDFWRQHLPPGWTIGGYTCEEFERLINQLEAVQLEMERTVNRIHRAQADFEETFAHVRRDHG